MQFFASLGHPVMAMSLRGCGLSDKPADPEMYDLETCLVADLRAGLEYATLLANMLTLPYQSS